MPKPEDHPVSTAPADDARRSALLAEAAAHRARRSAQPEQEAPRGRKHRRLNRWLFRIILFLLLVITMLVFLPKIGELLRPSLEIELPDSMDALLPDETMGYSKFDFSNAILGESREKSDFVVLEQDVSVTSRVSQALANLALFEKSQIIRSYGTGVYTVDLSQLGEQDVTLDETTQIVTVVIPHAKLSYVTVDLDKTEYEETQKALFAFGEIKLTSKQTNILEQNIEDAMREQLTAQDMLEKADTHALSQVQSLFEPIVQSVAPSYVVEIEFAD